MSEPITLDLDCTADLLRLWALIQRRKADPLYAAHGIAALRDDTLGGATVRVVGVSMFCSPRAFALFAEHARSVGARAIEIEAN